MSDTQKIGSLRSQATTEIKKLRTNLQKSPLDVRALNKSIRILEDYQQRINVLDTAILKTLTESKAIEDELQKSGEYYKEMLESKVDAEVLLKEIEQSALLSSSSSGNLSNSQRPDASKSRMFIKLPKFEMETYSGDPIAWQSFWDKFKVAIHDNETLSDIEKFTYLLGYLTDEAHKVASGYQLTIKNYEQVIAALKERFGDPQRAMFAHFEAMLAIPVANHDVDQLQGVSDECEMHIRSLDALGLAEDTFGIVFAPIILSKLPKYVRTELFRKNKKQKWTLDNIRTWLKEEIHARDLGESGFASNHEQRKSKGDKAGQGQGKGKPKEKNGARPPTSGSSLIASQRPKKGAGSAGAGGKRGIGKCIFCNQSGHYADQCQKFPDIPSRRAALSPKACFSCLWSEDHRRNDCPQKDRVCFHCQKPGHHRSLCTVKFGAAGKSGSTMNPGARVFTPGGNPIDNGQAYGGGDSSNVAVANQLLVSDGDVPFLPTAVAIIRNGEKKLVSKGRLLMDSASSRSYITRALYQKLRLRNIGSTYVSVGHFGSNRRSTSETKRVMFEVECSDGSWQQVLAYVTPIISCPVSRVSLDPKRLPLLNQLPLAEPLNTRDDELELDVLIGSDQYYNFVDSMNIITCKDGPVFVSSRLGYLTAGTTKVDESRHSPSNTLTLLMTEAFPGDTQQSGNLSLERFWHLEEVGSRVVEKSEADQKAMDAFQSTVQFQDGRYSVCWPWKTENPELPNNYTLAFCRLQSTIKRLRQDGSLFAKYRDIIEDQLSRGIIERAPEKPDGPVYFVPHHGVCTPDDHKTTKLRVVYDASSKASKDVSSLNDCLFRGPVILEDLVGLIFRFRLHEIALVSDIEKAFLQVSLQTSQRDVGRFLWLKSIHKPVTKDNVVQYRFTRVFFGVISSPFLLAAAIDTHLGNSESPVAEKIRRNIYVDNVITGETSVENAVGHYQTSKKLFKQASMNLREFYSNSEDVQKCFQPEDRGKNDEPKVLGISWDLKGDTLRCASMKPKTTAKLLTKRAATKFVAGIFDPSGWFGPVVLKGKLLVQELWENQFEWDDKIEEEGLFNQWIDVRTEFLLIPSQSIPRLIGKTSASVQLHVFCDASGSAAGACAYLRFEDDSSGISSSLLFAKNRLSPLKNKHTIPRLELVAMDIGAKMVQFVRNQLHRPISASFVWSDSQCVLHWLQKEKLPSRFVKSRVLAIKTVPDVSYKFVRSAENPADVLSRSCSVSALMSHPLWWHGPEWLAKTEASWPSEGPVFQEDPEEKAEKSVQFVTIVQSRTPKGIIDPAKFSSLTKLLRATAYVRRFVKNTRVKREERQKGPLLVSEVSGARSYWEQLCQRQGFPEAFTEDKSLFDLLRKRMHTLNVKKDNAGFLRCYGRQYEAQVPFERKCQLLLPKNHPYTTLVLRHVHEVAMHAGVCHSIMELRKTYWVPQCRPQLKRVISECRICRRVEGGPYRIPDAPDVPQFRLSVDPPFTFVGVDYLGPLLVKSKDLEKRKVWIALFTCAATRAVHLEVVDSQSSEDFHLALRRFIAWYNTPSLMVSDNASQFVAVNDALDTLRSKSAQIEEFCSAHNIEWKFLPQMAPWMGGFYERLIGVVKRFLKKALNGVCVSGPELTTVVVEIASIINSRPLLYNESDVSSPQLCPADFLGRAGKKSIPSFNTEGYPIPKSTKGTIMAQWKRLQAVTENFWNLWRQGYLTSLKERSSRSRQRNTSDFKVCVGAVVQVKDKVPRAQWKLGKIEELTKSRDGKIRSVKVKLSNGYTIIRPIKLLYPLELGQCDEHTEPAESDDASDGSDPDGDGSFYGFSPNDVQDAHNRMQNFQSLPNPSLGSKANSPSGASTVSALATFADLSLGIFQDKDPLGTLVVTSMDNPTDRHGSKHASVQGSDTRSESHDRTRTACFVPGEAQITNSLVRQIVLLLPFTRSAISDPPKCSPLSGFFFKLYVLIILLLILPFRHFTMHIVEVISGHPLSRDMTYGSSRGLRLRDIQGFTSIQQILGYLKLIHHGHPEEAQKLLTDPLVKWQPTPNIERRLNNVVGSADKMLFVFETEEILRVVMYHQINDPNNPFRESLQYYIKEAGGDTQKLEFRVYSSSGEAVYSSGNKFRRTWCEPCPGSNLYAKILKECAEYVSANTQAPDEEIESFLDNPDMFPASSSNGVLIVTDSQTRYVDKIQKGEVVPIGGGRYGHMVNALRRKAIGADEYELIVCYSGTNVAVTSKYTAQQRTAEFAELRSELLRLAKKRVLGTVLFCCAVIASPKHADVVHAQEVEASFANTQVSCINWNNVKNPFVKPTGRPEPSLFVNVTVKDPHLSPRGFQVLWRQWVARIPDLGTLNYKLLNVPLSVNKFYFAEPEMEVEPRSPENAVQNASNRKRQREHILDRMAHGSRSERSGSSRQKISRVSRHSPKNCKDSAVPRKDGDVSTVWRQPTPRSSRRRDECDRGEAGRKDTSYPSRNSNAKPKTASSNRAGVNGSDTTRSESHDRTRKKAHGVPDLRVHVDSSVGSGDVELHSRAGSVASDVASERQHQTVTCDTFHRGPAFSRLAARIHLRNASRTDS